MPLYPYRCTQCGHRFEKIQHFGAEPEKICPQCGGMLERTLTAPGLSFKGAGWYVNDYASKSSAPAGESASDAKSDKKSETKSQPKAPSSSDSAAASPAHSGPASKPGTTAK
ncbi:MAG: FmdB family zinc ribbon protein [Terracidiphilus sp.]